MASSTVENYLKQIFLLQQDDSESLVPMGKLALAMNVVPGTATSMVKALADSGLVDYEPRGGLRLTAGGRQLALHVLRRHRILELFLVDVLGLDWSEVHEEAETLEHAISDKVLERMDRLLNYPQYDPHGDPIPTAEGTIQDVRLVPLIKACALGLLEIARVSDQDSSFLQFIERTGLTPGTYIRQVSFDPNADAITVQLESGESLILGGTAAEKILVREISSSSE